MQALPLALAKSILIHNNNNNNNNNIDNNKFNVY